MRIEPLCLKGCIFYCALFLLGCLGGCLCTNIWLPPAYAGQVVFEAMPAQPFNHNAFAYVLQRFVSPSGYVAWPSLKAFPLPLYNYFSLLAMASPVSHPELFPKSEDRLCYWLNVWFAMQLQQAVYNYGFPPQVVKANSIHAPSYQLGGQVYKPKQVKQTLMRSPEVLLSPNLQQLLQYEATFRWPFSAEPFTPENLNQRLQARTAPEASFHYLKQ